MKAVSTIGFLHTADVHVGTFRALAAELAPDAADVHLVDPTLLTPDLTPELRKRLQTRLRELRDAGADVILCTCSSLGGHAERADPGIPVVRIDRPMAEAAVAAGGRIAVVVTAESTLEPTLDLLRECAGRAGKHVTLLPYPCFPAWDLFVAGDLDAYAGRIATHCREIAPRADVVVLGQAGMASAAERLVDLPIPVLTSPRMAVQRTRQVLP
jgi:Asp/Glu/hydantoin racemase